MTSFDMDGSAVVVDSRHPEDPLVYEDGNFWLNTGCFTVFNSEQIAKDAISVSTRHPQGKKTTLLVCPIIGGGYQVP